MKAATAAEAAKLLILILNGGQGVNRTLDTKIFSLREWVTAGIGRDRTGYLGTQSTPCARG